MAWSINSSTGSKKPSTFTKPIGFCCNPSCPPSDHLEKFFKSAEPAGKCDESIRRLDIRALRLVHIRNNVEFGQLKVGQFLSHQALRYYTGHTPSHSLSTSSARTPISPQFAAAINQFDVLAANRLPSSRLPAGKHRVCYARSTKDTLDAASRSLRNLLDHYCTLVSPCRV
jgi:hypothetical protein